MTAANLFVVSIDNHARRGSAGRAGRREMDVIAGAISQKSNRRGLVGGVVGENQDTSKSRGNRAGDRVEEFVGIRARCRV